MAEPIATKEQELAWYNVIGKFQAQVKKFEAMLAKLQNQKAIAMKDPELAQEYQAVMAAATAVQKKIVEIRNATASTVNWLKDIFTFSGINGLGALPLIPIAVVVAAIAAMSKWGSDAYIFSEKLDKVAELEQKGMPTAQAVATVQKLTPTTSLLGFDPKWWVIGGIGLIGLFVALPAIRSRTRAK